MKETNYFCPLLSIKVHDGHCLTFYMAGAGKSCGKLDPKAQFDNPRGACACCNRGLAIYEAALARLKAAGVSVVLSAQALTELRRAAKGNYGVKTGLKRVTWHRASHAALIKEGCLVVGESRQFKITEKGLEVLEILEDLY